MIITWFEVAEYEKRILSSAESGPGTAYYFHANVRATSQHTFERSCGRSDVCVTWLKNSRESNRRYPDQNTRYDLPWSCINCPNPESTVSIFRSGRLTTTPAPSGDEILRAGQRTGDGVFSSSSSSTVLSWRRNRSWSSWRLRVCVTEDLAGAELRYKIQRIKRRILQ